MAVFPSSEGGITPARAGNSWMFLKRIIRRWDHPRACGEQIDLCYARVFLKGSPPRVRGTAFSFSLLAIDTRITPARAGNRFTLSHCAETCQDHPRACGEQ